MSSESRSNRDLLVDVDMAAMVNLARVLGANQKQFRNAYSRAIKRTGVTLKKRAMDDLRDGLQPRKLSLLRKRLLSFRFTHNQDFDAAKLWFGLNALKVKDLKGKVAGRTRQHHARRDPTTGRYIQARKRKALAPPVFTPAGTMLSPATYTRGEIGRSKREGRRTILIRDSGTRRAREAELDIDAPVLDYVGDASFVQVMKILWHHFDADLRGRLKAKVDV